MTGPYVLTMNYGLAIGPTFENWNGLDRKSLAKKKTEQERLYALLKKLSENSTSRTLCRSRTPKTIERYNMKNGGAVAGPKQMLGQHMFKRLKTRDGMG